ncbi:hypothetical protein COJ96_06045 [Bacillus sp. AFS073361]|nr:hypothetical protein COJ96_06045 [Bacillus sp. AFS073361]
MKQVYKYDSAGKYVEPVLIADGAPIPANCTDKPLPQPNWKPVLKNGAWVETGTPPSAPTPKPTVEQEIADLWYAVMMGGVA